MLYSTFQHLHTALEVETHREALAIRLPRPMRHQGVASLGARQYHAVPLG